MAETLIWVKAIPMDCIICWSLSFRSFRQISGRSHYLQFILLQYSLLPSPLSSTAILGIETSVLLYFCSSFSFKLWSPLMGTRDEYYNDYTQFKSLSYYYSYLLGAWFLCSLRLMYNTHTIAMNKKKWFECN